MSPSSQAVSAAECVELRLVALELLPLGGDDIGRSVLDEPLVRELRSGAGDLLAEPLALDLDGAVGVDRVPFWLDDGIEDPFLLTLELDERAAAAERHRGALNTGHRRPGVQVDRAGRGATGRRSGGSNGTAPRSPR